MKNIQPQIQENFNSYVTSQGFSNKQKQNLNMGMNFGNSATPFKKPSDNLDFFQNAVPVDKGLKINKLNSNFKNDDLI